jgi:hypothetical protein
MSYSLAAYLFIGLHISAVNKVTGYELDNRGSVLGKNRNSIFDIASILDLEPAQSYIQSIPGVLYPVVRRPEREADHRD